ncbi:MAG: S1 RNA-binding domain-containing protein [Bacteroidota bacterium]
MDKSRMHSTFTEYGASEQVELTQLYTQHLNPITPQQLCQGHILQIDDHDIIVSIGAKADAIMPRAEFRDLPDIQIGDQVDLFVEQLETPKGDLLLSYKKANLIKAWQNIQTAHKTHQPISATVKRKTRGGLILDLMGIEAFMPGSQIELHHHHDWETFLGKQMDVAVLKFNEKTGNVVVSHKAILSKILARQQHEVSGSLEPGQILEGRVKNLTHFGAFIDLGGLDGLLHITDMSWQRIEHPSVMLSLGQQVRVVVTDYDSTKKRISLGLKQLTPHPWEDLPTTYQVGQQVSGKIVKVMDYGLFIEITPGIEGLMHVSEMSWSQHTLSVKKEYKVGDKLTAAIVSLDKTNKRMSLGLKQLRPDPWTTETILNKYSVGSRHHGTVKQIMHYGGWLSLSDDLEGLLHISEMSWTRKLSSPHDILKPGLSLEVQIIGVDRANRRLSLGIKQLLPNPWQAHSDALSPGSIHEGVLIKKTHHGALVCVLDALSVFVPRSHLRRRDGSDSVVLGLRLPFKVLEFSSTEEHLSLSHTATFDGDKQKIQDNSSAA